MDVFIEGGTQPPPPLIPLEISTTSLPGAVEGQPYSATISASGGDPPYELQVDSGNLPAGVSFDDGLIAGVPQSSGSFQFVAEVDDSAAHVATRMFSLTVSRPRSRLRRRL